MEVLFETCCTQFIKNGDISLRKKSNLNINVRSAIKKKRLKSLLLTTELILRKSPMSHN